MVFCGLKDLANESYEVSRSSQLTASTNALISECISFEGPARANTAGREMEASNSLAIRCGTKCLCQQITAHGKCVTLYAMAGVKVRGNHIYTHLYIYIYMQFIKGNNQLAYYPG